jgi:PBSX family phage terminase large subunit
MILPILVGVDKKTGKPRPYQPEAQQIAFHKSDAKFRAFFGGVGCGKTIASCVEALKTMLKYPGSEGLIGRYTDRELRQTTWKEFINMVPPALIADNNKAQLRLLLKNGSICYGMHLQNEERIRSMSLDWAVIDEACEVSETIYNQLLARLRGAVGPRRIWLVGNPEGHNWIYRKFVQPWMQQNEPDSQRYFQGRTVDVSFLPPDYIAALYDAYDEDWANRFINGSWEVFEGQVYPMFDRDVHVLPADFKISDTWSRYRAVDHGWTDPCAAVWMAVDHAGNHYIYDEYYRKLTTIEENSKAILERSGEQKFVYSVLAPFSDKIEPGKGKKYSDIYREAGLHLVEQRSRVMAGIARVREMLEPREGRKHPINRHATRAPKLYVLSNCRNTIREFQVYRFPPLKDEKSSPDKPLDKDNHALDAIRGLIMFNPNQPEEKTDGTMEDWINHLLEAEGQVTGDRREIIGNERVKSH